MHELSIALSIIEEVERQAESRGTSAVETIYVRVGALSGVDAEALAFAYELAREGTMLADCRLEIEQPPLRVRCLQCGLERATLPQNLACPSCPAAEQEILQGKELEVRAFEIAA